VTGLEVSAQWCTRDDAPYDPIYCVVMHSLKGNQFCTKLTWDSGEIDYAQVIGAYWAPDVRTRY
jgi:hypothetical protein